jgi:hypothetical protein
MKAKRGWLLAASAVAVTITLASCSSTEGGQSNLPAGTSTSTGVAPTNGTSSPAALKGSLYFSTLETSSRIGTFDLATGQTTYIGSTGVYLTDIAFLGDRLYGVTFTSLYEIDQTSGTAKQVAALGGMGGVNSLAGRNGTLYAATTAGEFLTIDPQRGTVARSQLGNGFKSSGDLAFLSDGTLVLAANTGGPGSDELVRVDVGSGSASQIGSIGFGGVYGLALVDGKLIGLTAGGDVLVIDPATGAGEKRVNGHFAGPIGGAAVR